MVRPVYYIYKQTRPFYSHVKKKKRSAQHTYIHPRCLSAAAGEKAPMQTPAQHAVESVM